VLKSRERKKQPTQRKKERRVPQKSRQIKKASGKRWKSQTRYNATETRWRGEGAGVIKRGDVCNQPWRKKKDWFKIVKKKRKDLGGYENKASWENSAEN